MIVHLHKSSTGCCCTFFKLQLHSNYRLMNSQMSMILHTHFGLFLVISHPSQTCSKDPAPPNHTSSSMCQEKRVNCEATLAIHLFLRPLVVLAFLREIISFVALIEVFKVMSFLHCASLASSLFLHFEHAHSFYLNHHLHPIQHILRSSFLPWSDVVASFASPEHNPSCTVQVPPSFRPSPWSRHDHPSFFPIRCLTSQSPIRTCWLHYVALS